MQPTSQLLLNVFSVFNETKVECLLIGGQACVIYGAKTSTIDVDITVLTSEENIANLLVALRALEARPSPASVLPDPELLSRGHSLHYYCDKQGFNGIRLDVLGTLPRLDPFSVLWKRRFEYVSDLGVVVPILSLPDLIQSKKTGRIKDAADIAALVNSHYLMNHLAPEDADIQLWLLEAREVDVLSMFVEKYPTAARRLIKTRPLLRHVLEQNISALKGSLIAEATNEAVEHEDFRGPLRLEARSLARTKRKGG